MERSSFRYFYPLSVRYNEVDAQGIVFNAHYLTWYDMAVSAYIRAAGWDNRAEIKASGPTVAAAPSACTHSCSCVYLSDMVFPLKVKVLRFNRGNTGWGEKA